MSHAAPMSGIILTPWATTVPNFVSVVASVAELARGEKSPTQSVTHSSSFNDMPGTEAEIPRIFIWSR